VLTMFWLGGAASRAYNFKTGAVLPVQVQNQRLAEGCNDAQTDMPKGIPMGAMCVQRLDDSLNSAIHINYRVSLRSSSMREPRDPLLKVLIFIRKFWLSDNVRQQVFEVGASGRLTGGQAQLPKRKVFLVHRGLTGSAAQGTTERVESDFSLFGNDPSAGSPTETLLRLLLPLNDQV
jgi:hypothetical protein